MADEVSIRDLIDTLAEERAKQLDLRFEAIEGRIQAERDLRVARREDDLRAAEKAERTMNQRLETMNQFRQQVLEERSQFMTRELGEEQNDRNDRRFLVLERFQARMMGGLIVVGTVGVANFIRVWFGG